MTQESTLYDRFVQAHPTANFREMDHRVPGGIEQSYAARKQYLDFGHQHMSDLISSGNAKDSVSVLDELHRDLKGSPFEKIIEEQRASHTATHAAQSANAAASNINASRWSLPKGISAGKLTAYLAGAAVVAGAAYALWPKDKPEEVKKNTPSSWVDRVDQSRMQSNYVGH